MLRGGLGRVTSEKEGNICCAAALVLRRGWLGQSRAVTFVAGVSEPLSSHQFQFLGIFCCTGLHTCSRLCNPVLQFFSGLEVRPIFGGYGYRRSRARITTNPWRTVVHRKCPEAPDFYALAYDKSVCYRGQNYGNRCTDIGVGELAMARSDACHKFGFIHWEDYRGMADISGIVAMLPTLTVRGWRCNFFGLLDRGQFTLSDSSPQWPVTPAADTQALSAFGLDSISNIEMGSKARFDLSAGVCIDLVQGRLYCHCDKRFPRAGRCF